MDSQIENEILASMTTFPTTSFDFFDLNIFQRGSGDGLASSPDERFFADASYDSQQKLEADAPLLSSSAETCDFGPSAATLATVPDLMDTQALTKGQLCPNFEPCNMVALNTIRNLHVKVEDCLSTKDETPSSLGDRVAQRQQSRATDVVLAQHAEATPAVRTILKCTCCMQPRFQMLVATILDKLVKWCDAVVQSISGGASSQDSQGGEHVRRQSIAIGNHQLEGDLDVPIISHVVLERLEKLGHLVDMLSARMEESNGRMEYGGGGFLPMPPLREVGLLEIVRDRLIVCLTQQIGTVREGALRLRQRSVAT